MEKIIIIGAVASGTSAGAKARRNDENVNITIYEKDKFISYSGCGMPYFIGGEIDSIDSLTPRDPVFFKKKYNINVCIGHEVISIDKNNKSVEVKNLDSGEIFTDNYDKLIIATGAIACKPDFIGCNNENVHTLRNINDAIKVKNYINNSNVKNAVVVGSGFIGFEILESLLHLGINVTLVERNNKLTPNLDIDMSLYLENELDKKNVTIMKNTTVVSVVDNIVTLSNDTKIDADVVILAIGVMPNTHLAQSIGVELGVTNAIKVDTKMQTNITDILACGDCVETYSTITNKPVYRPLGSTANKTGRIAGDIATGGNLEYKGNLSTGIFKFFDLTIATTGLSEEEAIANGYDIEICHNIKPDKPEYMMGKEMVIKAIADKNSSRLLGVEIIGYDGVDKRIDVFATLITYKASVDELFHLDLAYAPPFSTTKDPVHYTGMILDNAINHNRGIMTTQNLENITEKVQIIDTRSLSDYEQKGHVNNAINIPQAKLRGDNLGLDKDILTITYCNKGVTGNASQNILIGRGFKNVLNLSGGHRFYKATKK